MDVDPSIWRYRHYLPTEEELQLELERERVLAVKEEHAVYRVDGDVNDAADITCGRRVPARARLTMS